MSLTNTETETVRYFGKYKIKFFKAIPYIYLTKPKKVQVFFIY